MKYHICPSLPRPPLNTPLSPIPAAIDEDEVDDGGGGGPNTGEIPTAAVPCSGNRPRSHLHTTISTNSKLFLPIGRSPGGGEQEAADEIGRGVAMGDDEFGDLYTDILLPPPQLPASSSFAAPAKPAPLSDLARPHPASVRPPVATAGGGFNWEEDDSATDGGDSDPSARLARVSGIGGDSEATVIPGLALASGLDGVGYGVGLDEDGGEDDSDSEDDLQIVLNDDANPIAMHRRAMQGMGDEDDDEDGDDLVIVTGDDVNVSQPMEEQEGGDETGAAAGEGERKDGADAGKANGGVAGAFGARIGYSNHAYNPHHSQFKVSLYGV